MNFFFHGTRSTCPAIELTTAGNAHGCSSEVLSSSRSNEFHFHGTRSTCLASELTTAGNAHGCSSEVLATSWSCAVVSILSSGDLCASLYRIFFAAHRLTISLSEVMHLPHILRMNRGWGGT